MRAVRGVGQHAVALKIALQHVAVVRLFLPATLKRERQGKLRQKLLAGIRHIFSDSGAVLRTPAADLLGQRDKFFIPRTKLRVVAHLAQRGVTLFQQTFEIAPGGEKTGFVVKASPVEERSSVFGAAVE